MADPHAPRRTPEPSPPTPRRVVVGVGAGIAAYKVAYLVRAFAEAGHHVDVVPTPDALRFVGEATWAALSGRPVRAEVWDDVPEVPHVRLGQDADLVVVAPATADLLARARQGRADDLLTSTLLTARCPVVFAPAMHTEMWEHPATQDNVAVLRERGALVIAPASGRLTGADSGSGRLPEPDEIYAICRLVLERGIPASDLDLAGRRVAVSAGGTREYLDPVRFLGNRSSGRQGYALARAAVARGAEVTVVAANVALPEPAGAHVLPVVSTEELRAAMRSAAEEADAVVMAAAPADFRPVDYVDHKIKKTSPSDAPELQLTQTPDVLAELAAHRSHPGQVVVGFAAETGDKHGDVLAHGRDKLARKGADLLVVNEVGPTQGFEVEDNAATILAADGTQTTVPYGAKELLAHAVWDAVVPRLP